ncbi:MAG TPA: S8 family serine peptidase [Thermoanaerobaculia bacterium]|nr:S8 family serine peptidase [Thermoanaerobaculia bacterium]
MQKSVFLSLALALLFAAGASAAMNGQILNCDAPNPTQPQNCVDNWALDLLDESKTAIETAPGALPRDRKHYFDGDGTGVHIFILDTGVDGTNPDFKTLGNPAGSRLGLQYPGYLNIDGGSSSHGTRVAGLAAGLQYGVAKGATIHPIYTAGSINPTGGDALLARLDWVLSQVRDYAMKPAVLNMSFNILSPVKNSAGQNMEPQLTAKVLELISNGVVVTVSAGNQNGNPAALWPSKIQEVILVGGVDEYGNRWVRDTSDPEWQALCVAQGDCGSNYGTLVDIWAPAKYIRSAVKSGQRDENGRRISSGTSYAAPLVAGLAALHLQQNPTATPAAVRSALLGNAANLGDIDGSGYADYMARSPVATPACNVTQRLFVNTGLSVRYFSSQLRDSCPAGYDATSQFNAAHGQIGITGIGPNDISYSYIPSSGYTGTDQFNYDIYTNFGGSYGTGTVAVTVQPNHN